MPGVRLATTLRYATDPLSESVCAPLGNVVLTSTDLDEINGPPLQQQETVVIQEETMNSMQINYHVQSRRILVISDRWDPDWVAQVDGSPRSIITLFDSSMRGVVVSPGEVALTMRYAPESVSRAVYWTVTGLILFVLLVLWEFLAPWHKRIPGIAAAGRESSNA